jgi:hypothetical protein
MSKRSWIPALLTWRPPRAKTLGMHDVRVAPVNAPVDFNDDRVRYEVEILNADALNSGEAPRRSKPRLR